jgi:hypothetical protein
MSLWQLGMDSDQKIAKGFSFSVPPTDLLILMTLSFVGYQDGNLSFQVISPLEYLYLFDNCIEACVYRIYVDLPDAENRLKILKIFLTPENLETGFEFDKLAKETEGYSGSDLKNLCIAAAYRPVQELLQEENKDSVTNASPDLRPLSLDDFIQSKAKVSPSVAYDATTMNELRKWNEQYGEGGTRTKSPFGF